MHKIFHGFANGQAHSSTAALLDCKHHQNDFGTDLAFLCQTLELYIIPSSQCSSIVCGNMWLVAQLSQLKDVHISSVLHEHFKTSSSYRKIEPQTLMSTCKNSNSWTGLTNEAAAPILQDAHSPGENQVAKKHNCGRKGQTAFVL